MHGRSARRGGNVEQRTTARSTQQWFYRRHLVYWASSLDQSVVSDDEKVFEELPLSDAQGKRIKQQSSPNQTHDDTVSLLSRVFRHIIARMIPNFSKELGLRTFGRVEVS
jgi:hypothetical protein